MKKKIVIFAPHPDDETLACGGTIAKKISEGYEVFVVFMTDARYSLTAVGITSGPLPHEVSIIRREEAVKAMKTLGLKEKNIFFLNFEDKTLKMRYRDALKKVIEILADISPVEVYFPQRKEYHIDHRVTNLIVREALKRLNLHPIEFQYAIAWSFPYHLLVHVLNEQLFDSLMSNILKLDMIHVNISKFLHLKSKALNEYKTQMMAFSYNERKNLIKRSFLKRFLKKEEKFFVNSSMLIIS